MIDHIMITGCAALLRRLLYPLLSSLIALSLFLLSKNRGSRENASLMEGERGGGVALVCEEANFSLYTDHVKAGCLLLLKTDGREEEDSMVFAGKIVAGSSVDAFAESIAYDEVDHLAEALWDGCFGSFSKWNYYVGV